MTEDWTGLATTLGFGSEAAMLRWLYEEEGLPLMAIAKKLDCSRVTVRNRLMKHHIPLRRRGGANNTHKFTAKLCRMDQRVVFTVPDAELSTRLGMHPSTIYKYKRSVTGV